MGEIVAITKEVTREIGQGASNGKVTFKGKVTFPKLEAKLTSYDKHQQGREWAQVSFALGKLYLAAGKPNKAEQYLKNALEELKSKYPWEIASLRLRDALSKSERDQRKYDEVLQEAERHGEALKEAEKALGLDPFNPSRYEELGGVHADFEALKDAQAAWETALLWNPYDPIVCTKIGRSHYLLIRDCHNIDNRKAASQQAVGYLERALHLYGSDQMESKGETHHFLGLLRLDSGECDKAISHLKVAHALGFTPWITSLFLGEAYRQNNSSNECMKQYRRLIEEVEESTNGSSEILGKESGNPISRGEILARAHCGLAFEYADRGVKLDTALFHVEKARTRARNLEDEAKDRYLAECASCEGWIRYKQDAIDEAIECLEDAVALNADAKGYLHLALAHERQARRCKDEDQARLLSTRARTHCRQAQKMDIKKEYSQDADELLDRLKEFEKNRSE
jgi:tetratricopeptide (TPR) repeat protein